MDINTRFLENLSNEELTGLENSITILIKELVNQNKTSFYKSELEEIARQSIFRMIAREDK